VELRGVVERVLPALRLDLDELLLDGGDLLFERAGRPPEPRGPAASLGAFLPAVDLCTELPDRVDGLVDLAELVADPQAERELRIEIGLRRGDARILHDLERHLVPLARDLDTNAVVPRGRDRPGQRGLRRPALRIIGAPRPHR